MLDVLLKVNTYGKFHWVDGSLLFSYSILDLHCWLFQSDGPEF